MGHPERNVGPDRYQRRVARIRAHITPRIAPARTEDVRRDVLWLLAELEESRAALAEARRAS